MFSKGREFLRLARSLALPMDNYTISANATVVEGDTDPDNNLYTCEGIIARVHLVADVSSSTPGVPDGVVNIKDIAYLISYFNTKPDNMNWNPDADFTGDGVVNMRDIALAIQNFNTSA